MWREEKQIDHVATSDERLSTCNINCFSLFFKVSAFYFPKRVLTLHGRQQPWERIMSMEKPSLKRGKTAISFHFECPHCEMRVGGEVEELGPGKLEKYLKIQVDSFSGGTRDSRCYKLLE